VKGVIPDRFESLRDPGFGHDDIESVLTARRNEELRRYAGLNQALRIRDVLFHEQVDRSYRNECRREATQILGWTRLIGSITAGVSASSWLALPCEQHCVRHAA
jgi:hypothetical protein